VITGPAATEYTFEAPPPGTYFFLCKIHPTQMTGALTVT
jgi:plastocyanin